MGFVDDALVKLGITLPAAPKPVASYVPFVRTGSLVFVAGQLPFRDGKLAVTGAVGVTGSRTVEEGKEGARIATLNGLAILKDACGGDLDRIARIVRIGVFVQCAAGFDQQPAVANGASDLLVAVFGDAGKHARAAVGTNSLPLNATVEVELLAEVK